MKMNKKILGKALKIRDTFAILKYRFDLGVSFIVFINFSLLVITASTKLQTIFKVSTFRIYIILVPVALIGTVLFGYFLDKVIKHQRAYVKHQHSNSPQIMGILKIVQEIQKEQKKK